MHVEVIEAGADLKSVVLNLGLYYIYDFSEHLGFRCPDDGLFGTSHWSKYWDEPDRWAFLVKVDGELAGFVFISPDGTQPGSQFGFGEFFIMRKFRKQGVGQKVAFKLFDRFRGPWEVRVVTNNESALAFWRKVLHRYTEGNYHELPEPVVRGQWECVVTTFDNTK